MVEDGQLDDVFGTMTTEECLSKAQALVPTALQGKCHSWLVSEAVVPPLTRLAESGSAICREKATISLQRLSMSSEAAKSIVECGGTRALIDVCQTGDSVSQAAAVCTLKNISFIPEAHQTLAEEGIAEVMISLLDDGILLESKEYAAECLQILSSSNDHVCKSVVAGGGIRSLLAYMDGPLPQESAVCALRNLVCSVPSDNLISLGLLPRLVHVLKSDSTRAHQAAASIICRICSSPEIKRLISEAGCIPLLVKMLEAKVVTAREVAAQAISSLITLPHNCQELKKDQKSIPNLVHLLDPSPDNTTKKYALSSLLLLTSSRKCKKLMISYGAIGYLKKLNQMEVPGANKLLERLERGTLKSLFSK
ncbi:hypothetical protein Leryth_026641 [Lithospermum erythrorhizon]|nr:hypothetical protein Leryth_026641 [Lithospermum erythrorhizon]